MARGIWGRAVLARLWLGGGESVLRTQGEDFWDDAQFLAGALNETPIALLDKDWEGDEC